MDFFNNLLSTAAGYFGDQKANDAKVELAKLGVNQTVANDAAVQRTAAVQAQAQQWIPGVSNGLVVAAGAGLLALTVVFVIAKK